MKWVREKAYLEFDDARELLGAFGIAQDVTERKQLETELAMHRDQLEALVEARTEELNEANKVLNAEIKRRKTTEKQLVELNENLRQQAALLRALTGEVTLSEQRERRRLAKILHDHLQQLLVAARFRAAILGRAGDEIVKQAADEIEGLLDECISESRSLTVELSPPILHEGGLKEGIEWLARMMSDRHGLIVDLSIEEDLSPLEDNLKVQLSESVRELLFNAVKHARVSSARVNIRVIEHGKIQITVSDSGPGFEPTDLPKAVQIGGGFGLFSIRERLALIGGEINIDSSPGTGCRIILTVPIREPKEAPVPVVAVIPSQSVEQPAVRPRLPKRGLPIRVLLADDHAVVRKGLARVLNEEPDIVVIGEAADGQQAVDLAQKLLPDVILMDISIPVLNGIEATRVIHNDHSDIRIIGLSMFEERERAQAIRDAGASGYVTKSGRAEDLIEAIRASAC